MESQAWGEPWGYASFPTGDPTGDRPFTIYALRCRATPMKRTEPCPYELIYQALRVSPDDDRYITVHIEPNLLATQIV